MHVQTAIVWRNGRSRTALAEILFANDGTRIFQQRAKQLEFDRRKPQFLALTNDRSRRPRKFEVADISFSGCACSSSVRSAARSREASEQFARIERLGKIIVRTRLQPDDPVGFVTTGGQHHTGMSEL